MEKLKSEISEAIEQLDSVKHKWPRMKTQDVIELLQRIQGRVDQLVECEMEEMERQEL